MLGALTDHLQVAARQGRLIIAPAGFTHTHKGNVSRSGDKYVATSWILFQRAERGRASEEKVLSVDEARSSGAVEEELLEAALEELELPAVVRRLAERTDVVLLDNMPTATIIEAVRRCAGRARTEISGNVTLARMPELAAVPASQIHAPGLFRAPGYPRAVVDHDAGRARALAALNAYLHSLAATPNPIGLLGAIYIIEGTGQRIVPSLLPLLRQLRRLIAHRCLLPAEEKL